MDRKEIKKLLETPGISGHETLIAKILEEKMTKSKLDIKRDNLGGIFGIKKSTNKKAKTVMIEAHMDEVGFVVADLLESGLIRFNEQGGIWKNFLPSQRVKVYTKGFKKSYTGVIVIDPNRLTIKQGNPIPDIDEMFIDIGAEDKKELIKMGIEQGNIAVFDSDVKFNGNRIISKAIDDRLGVALVIELIEYIKNKSFDYNIVIGCTTQEEVGLRGALVAAHKFKPDLAITIDISPSKDVPKHQGDGKLGGGTMLRHFDSSTLYLPQIIDFVEQTLNKHKIKWQDYYSLGGTDAGAIHKALSGIPCIPVGFLARNLHTSSLVADLRDYEETNKLLKALVNDLDNKKIENLIKYK